MIVDSYEILRKELGDQTLQKDRGQVVCEVLNQFRRDNIRLEELLFLSHSVRKRLEMLWNVYHSTNCTTYHLKILIT